MRIAAAAVRVFITDAVAAGTLAFLSKRTSSVLALITTPEKFMSLGSLSSSATEQVLVDVAVGLAEALADAVACGSPVGLVALNPPILNPPISSPRTVRPMTEPRPTSFRYPDFGLL